MKYFAYIHLCLGVGRSNDFGSDNSWSLLRLLFLRLSAFLHHSLQTFHFILLLQNRTSSTAIVFKSSVYSSFSKNQSKMRT